MIMSGSQVAKLDSIVQPPSRMISSTLLILIYLMYNSEMWYSCCSGYAHLCLHCAELE